MHSPEVDDACVDRLGEGVLVDAAGAVALDLLLDGGVVGLHVGARVGTLGGTLVVLALPRVLAGSRGFPAGLRRRVRRVENRLDVRALRPRRLDALLVVEGLDQAHEVAQVMRQTGGVPSLGRDGEPPARVAPLRSGGERSSAPLAARVRVLVLVGVLVGVVVVSRFRRRRRLRGQGHLQRIGGELLVELLRGVHGELGARAEGPVQLPRVVRFAELGIVHDLVKVALPEFLGVRLLVPLVRALSLGGGDVVGKVLDGELAEAQGLVVVSAAAPSPREASPGTPAAVIEPAALGRPRRRAAVVAVVAVERGSTARGRATTLVAAAAGTAAVVEVPGRGRTRGKRRSLHREIDLAVARRSGSVRDRSRRARRLRERGGAGHRSDRCPLERRGFRDEAAKRVRALPICPRSIGAAHRIALPPGFSPAARIFRGSWAEPGNQLRCQVRISASITREATRR